MEENPQFSFTFEENFRRLYKAKKIVFRTRFRPYAEVANYVAMAIIFLIALILLFAGMPHLMIMFLVFPLIELGGTLMNVISVKTFVKNLQISNGSLVRTATFGARLCITTASGMQNYEYSNIVGVKETAEQFVFKLNYNMVFSLPKAAIGEELMPFRAYINSIVPPLKPTKKAVIINILLTVLILAITVYMVILTLSLFSVNQ